MLLALERISVLPGQTLILRDVDWEEMEQILEELGEHRHSLMAYHQHQLEMMAPLPEHEIAKEAISDLLKTLLEELDIEFYPLGSTTFKHKLLGLGVEPDSCFYIQNEAKVRGKNRLDMTIDPPPDLALEVDVTSRTYLEIYAQLGVPEVWRFERGQLRIYCLEQGQYQEQEFSPLFPQLPLKQVMPQSLQRMPIDGRNKTIKAFRGWVQSVR
jgi:Uma2 family endonuclease